MVGFCAERDSKGDGFFVEQWEGGELGGAKLDGIEAGYREAGAHGFDGTAALVGEALQGFIV